MRLHNTAYLLQECACCNTVPCVPCLCTGRILLKGDNITLMQTTCALCLVARHLLICSCHILWPHESMYGCVCAEGGRSQTTSHEDWRTTLTEGGMTTCAGFERSFAAQAHGQYMVFERDSRLLRLQLTALPGLTNKEGSVCEVLQQRVVSAGCHCVCNVGIPLHQLPALHGTGCHTCAIHQG